jgi:CYTH domain-containing protein
MLESVPDDLSVDRTLEITDRYLPGTGLRLRLVEEAGTAPVRKLGHKVRLGPEQPSTVAHTTLYLDEQEYLLLLTLPGQELTKTRLLVAGPDPVWAVDLFHGVLEGLVLAEVDLGDRPDTGPVEPPGGPAVEVTRDERFTGGALAQRDGSGLADLLAQARSR